MDIFEGISESAANQLVELIERTTHKAILSLVIANAMFCYFLYGDVSLARILVWAFTATALVCLRLWRVTQLIKNVDMPYRSKLATVMALTLCTGTAYASIVSFFPVLGAFDRAMLTAMLIIICSGSVMTNSGYRPFYMLIGLPILISLAILWALNPGTPIDNTTSYAVSFVMIVVLITLWFLGKDTFAAFADSVRANEQLEILAAELKQALKTTEKAREQAEISSESKSRFLSAASHDLRQPVHVLTLYGAVLKRAKLDEETRSAVDDMNTAIVSLSSQIDSLLDLSRLDSGDIKPHKQPVALDQLLRSLEADFNELARSKGIAFINDIKQPVEIYSDPVMLTQILRNLCGNAIKYTQQGHVTVSLKEPQSLAPVLLVTDTGVGIPVENHRDVFDEFYQVDNPARDSAKGLGLGLPIVERLVKTLKQDITIDSTADKGTTVSITLEGMPHPKVRENEDILDKLTTDSHANV